MPLTKEEKAGKGVGTFLTGLLGPVTKQPLKVGDIGPEVEAEQTRLKQFGFDPGAIDGRFGKKTLKALTDFREAKQAPPAPMPLSAAQEAELAASALGAAYRRAPFNPADFVPAGDVPIQEQDIGAVLAAEPVRQPSLGQFPTSPLAELPAEFGGLEPRAADVLAGGEIGRVAPPPAFEAPPTFMGKLGEALATPTLQSALGQAAMALGAKTEGFGFQLGKGVVSAAEGQMYQSYVARLQAGESPAEITGPDVALLSPQLRLQAMQEVKTARAETPEERLAREVKVGRVLPEETAELFRARAAAAEPFEQRAIREQANIEIRTAIDAGKEDTANAYKVLMSGMKKLPGDLFKGGKLDRSLYMQALFGGQRILPELEMEAMKEAVILLQREGKPTFGLESLLEEIIETPDGKRWIVNPDGSRTQIE